MSSSLDSIVRFPRDSVATIEEVSPTSFNWNTWDKEMISWARLWFLSETTHESRILGSHISEIRSLYTFLTIQPRFDSSSVIFPVVVTIDIA